DANRRAEFVPLRLSGHFASLTRCGGGINSAVRSRLKSPFASVEKPCRRGGFLHGIQPQHGRSFFAFVQEPPSQSRFLGVKVHLAPRRASHSAARIRGGRVRRAKPCVHPDLPE